MNNVARFILAFGLCTCALAYGARIEGAPSGPCQGLKMATGPADKGYSKLFADLVRVSNNAIPLCEVNTEGGLDNLTTLSMKKADVGIVPIDALEQMKAGDANIAALQVVATLNSNFLHVVTSSRGYQIEGAKKFGVLQGDMRTVRINKLSELRGKTVALVGSAQLLVRQLDKTLGLHLRYVDVGSDAEAFKQVMAGSAYAAFSVAGWPHGNISKLASNSGLTLVGVDMAVNAPYAVRPFSYKNIGVYNVKALSVQNVLVTRPFSGRKSADVAALKQRIARELGELKDGDFEPAWNEITTLDGEVKWARFQGASGPGAGSNSGGRKQAAARAQ